MAVAVMRTSPVSVNLMALPTRLSSTWVRRCSSPRPTGSFLATSVLSASFLVSASDSVAARTVSTTLSMRVLAEVQAELAGLDLGDVEHGVDQAQQVLAVGADAGEGVHRFLGLAARRSLPASARRSRGWRRAGFAARGSCWRRTATCAGWRSRARGSSGRSPRTGGRSRGRSPTGRRRFASGRSDDRQRGNSPGMATRRRTPVRRIGTPSDAKQLEPIRRWRARPCASSTCVAQGLSRRLASAIEESARLANRLAKTEVLSQTMSLTCRNLATTSASSAVVSPSSNLPSCSADQ